MRVEYCELCGQHHFINSPVVERRECKVLAMSTHVFMCAEIVGFKFERIFTANLWPKLKRFNLIILFG